MTVASESKYPTNTENNDTAKTNHIILKMNGVIKSWSLVNTRPTATWQLYFTPWGSNQTLYLVQGVYSSFIIWQTDIWANSHSNSVSFWQHVFKKVKIWCLMFDVIFFTDIKMSFTGREKALCVLEYAQSQLNKLYSMHSWGSSKNSH